MLSVYVSPTTPDDELVYTHEEEVRKALPLHKELFYGGELLKQLIHQLSQFSLERIC